jgi:hypothetical protein
MQSFLNWGEEIKTKWMSSIAIATGMKITTRIRSIRKIYVNYVKLSSI